MSINGFRQQITRFCHVILLLCLPRFTFGSVLFVRLPDVSHQDKFQSNSLTNPGLDEDGAAWGVYVEGSPTWVLDNAASPSQDGNSLLCAITGGDPYSNVHCYRNLPAQSSSRYFLFSTSFYYQPTSSFNNVGEPSIVQGLEFTMNKWDQGIRYEWALQWDNVDQGAPKWRYWDPSHTPDKWVDLNISGSVIGEQWHTLKLAGEIFDEQVHYLEFILDGQEYPLDILVAPTSAIGEADRLAVAVQLDGNYEETPYELFIDQVALITMPNTDGTTFPAADFNGDGQTDVAVFRPSNSTWYIYGVGSFVYGQAGDIPVPADYNGDGKDEIAVFRPSNSTWYIYGVGSFVYGQAGDIPVPADYNGDGKDDIAVFRPSNSTWYILGVGPSVYGTAGDIPVVADYDGDGKDDIAVFRPSNSTWYLYGIGPRVYGTVGDIPVVADYNGDGKADIAVFRPSNSTWYLYGIGPRVYGTVGDIPVIGDYNGDGKADIAVFRPTNSTWYLYGIGPGVYGTVGDIPV